MDQNANGTAGQASDFYAAPQPLAATSTTPFLGPFNQDTLPLIVPGPHVVSSTPTGAAGHVRQPGGQRHRQLDRRRRSTAT